MIAHRMILASWKKAPAPGIKTHCQKPLMGTLALAAACRAVDSDIEKFGAVTYETVDQVRQALAMVRGGL